MTTLLQEIQNEFRTGRFQVEVKPVIMEIFLDLCWDDEPIDREACKRDPAIGFVGQKRLIALQRLKGEIRYYLGPNLNHKPLKDLMADDKRHEMGVIASISLAAELVES